MGMGIPQFFGGAAPGVGPQTAFNPVVPPPVAPAAPTKRRVRFPDGSIEEYDPETPDRDIMIDGARRTFGQRAAEVGTPTALAMMLSAIGETLRQTDEPESTLPNINAGAAMGMGSAGVNNVVRAVQDDRQFQQQQVQRQRESYLEQTEREKDRALQIDMMEARQKNDLRMQKMEQEAREAQIRLGTDENIRQDEATGEKAARSARTEFDIFKLGQEKEEAPLERQLLEARIGAQNRVGTGGGGRGGKGSGTGAPGEGGAASSAQIYSAIKLFGGDENKAKAYLREQGFNIPGEEQVTPEEFDGLLANEIEVVKARDTAMGVGPMEDADYEHMARVRLEGRGVKPAAGTGAKPVERAADIAEGTTREKDGMTFQWKGGKWVRTK